MMAEQRKQAAGQQEQQLGAYSSEPKEDTKRMLGLTEGFQASKPAL